MKRYTKCVPVVRASANGSYYADPTKCCSGECHPSKNVICTRADCIEGGLYRKCEELGVEYAQNPRYA